jgi:hypothetical protein
VSSAKGVPEFVRNSYPIIRAGQTFLSRDLAHSILNDVLTGKTVDEISVCIKKLRYTEYTRLLSSYYSILHFRSVKNFDSTNKFSSFEDTDRYNELAQPSAESIKQFFVHYVNERKEVLDACLDNLVPHSVISFDATFHIQKRIKVLKLYHYHIFVF